MDALQRDYKTKITEYERLIALNDTTKLPDIQALNSQLSAILHSMLEEVTKVRGSANNLNPYRDELMRKLVKIQNESSILLKQKDQYETLRALQAHEQTKFDETLFWYLISLGIVSACGKTFYAEFLDRINRIEKIIRKGLEYESKTISEFNELPANLFSNCVENVVCCF